MDCSSLETIELPASVNEVGDQAFYGAPLLNITIHYPYDREGLETDTSYHQAVLKSFYDLDFHEIDFIFGDGHSEEIDISD